MLPQPAALPLEAWCPQRAWVAHSWHQIQKVLRQLSLSSVFPKAFLLWILYTVIPKPRGWRAALAHAGSLPGFPRALACSLGGRLNALAIWGSFTPCG